MKLKVKGMKSIVKIGFDHEKVGEIPNSND